MINGLPNVRSKIIIPLLYSGVILLLMLYVFNVQLVKQREKSSFYRDLMEAPAYVRGGFDSGDILEIPDTGGGVWKDFFPPENRKNGVPSALSGQKPLRIKDSALPGLPVRPYLWPFWLADQEFTIIIPVEIDIKTAEEGLFVPGIFLSYIGDNWEVFLNGERVRSQMHRDAGGKIRSHRTWRGVYFPINKSLFRDGTNIVAFRIAGDPSYGATGLYYSSNYYLEDFRIIEARQQHPLLTALWGLYFINGLYYLVLYFSIRIQEEKFNLYYGFVSCMAGLYSLMRSNLVNVLIPNSNIASKIEYFSLFIGLALAGIFIESAGNQKITKVTRVYFIFSIVLAAAQLFFSAQFADDILGIWEIAVFAYLHYIFFYDIIYLLVIRRQRKNKQAFPIRGAPIITIVTSMFTIYLCGIFDILDRRFLHTGSNLVQYSIIMFVLGISFSLAGRLSYFYNRLGEINLKLNQSNTRLEAAVQKRTLELERQTAIALEASRAKSEFLAVMSHEIRTPLNAVIGLSEIELRSELPEPSKNNIERIYQSGSTLLGIVNDILDISKIEAGSLDIIPVVYETVPFINDTIQLNMVRIGSKPIHFILEMRDGFPSALRGDELRIKQILNNILSNAFKYTRNGQVTFGIAWEKQGEDALIRFTIRDTGIGIRKEDIGRLFTDYTQLDTRANRKIEGTGLGLTITKKLVEMMGGSISVESEYGKGSVFTIELVQGIADPAPLGADILDSLCNFRLAGIGRARDVFCSWMPYGKVLVVDDMPVNLEVALGLLAPYGLQADTAMSGQEAVERIRSGEPRYDLVFMDHMMPGIDGVTAVKLIREIDGDYARTVPIVALTANALTGNAEIFLSKGFNGFISKPIDLRQLDAVLNNWVRKNGNEESLSIEQEKPAAEARRISELDNPIDGIDLAEGRRRYNSDETYLDILRAYYVHTPPLLDKIRNIQEELNVLPDYTVLIHGLKGSSYGICAGELGRQAAELEQASREGNFEKIMEGNAPFIENAEKLLAALETLLSKTIGAVVKPAAPVPNPALLAGLLDAVNQYKSTLMEKTLLKLESYEYDSGGELVRWLREQMDNLEYDAIRRRLEEETQK